MLSPTATYSGMYKFNGPIPLCSVFPQDEPQGEERPPSSFVPHPWLSFDQPLK